ncbi:PbsX family transcriptional regulator [Burkholderia sp. S171]|uniref:AbrB/MazE/SpoVT family DNA-binding domain-containing protein n=1 Tax=Burkholderia sp. S171 TaxID=1641860 RepID=UPI00131C1494|nr:PbsX family transcriptional regulator [Burkholderia sp. S171]
MFAPLQCRRGLAAGVFPQWQDKGNTGIPHARSDKKTGSSDTPLVADGEGGCIATMPARFAEHDLDDLLAGMTQNNLHAEVGSGLAVGAEAF